MIIRTISMTKSCVFKIFAVHTKRKAGVFKFFRFEERFRKAPFSSRISDVWTVGQTVEIEMPFQISLV